MAQRFRSTTPLDIRCWLAQTIYSMTDVQQRTFRQCYPPGIPDEVIGEAYAYAYSIVGGKQCSGR